MKSELPEEENRIPTIKTVIISKQPPDVTNKQRAVEITVKARQTTKLLNRYPPIFW